jgi:hypothetical protein
MLEVSRTSRVPNVGAVDDILFVVWTFLSARTQSAIVEVLNAVTENMTGEPAGMSWSSTKTHAWAHVGNSKVERTVVIGDRSRASTARQKKLVVAVTVTRVDLLRHSRRSSFRNIAGSACRMSSDPATEMITCFPGR